jgi:hypothetical protein
MALYYLTPEQFRRKHALKMSLQPATHSLPPTHVPNKAERALGRTRAVRRHAPYMMGKATSSCLEASKGSFAESRAIRQTGEADTVVSDMAQLRKEARKNFVGGCQAAEAVAYCDSLGKDDPDQVDHTAKAINKGEHKP